MALLPPSAFSTSPFRKVGVQMIGGGDTNITSTEDFMYQMTPEFMAAYPDLAKNWLNSTNMEILGPDSFMVKSGEHTGSIYKYDPATGKVVQTGTQDWYTNPNRMKDFAPIMAVLGGAGLGLLPGGVPGADSAWWSGLPGAESGVMSGADAFLPTATAGGGLTPAALGADVLDTTLFSGLDGAPGGAWTPSGLSAEDLAKAGFPTGAPSDSANWLTKLLGPGGGINPLGTAGSLLQLLGGLYGAKKAGNIEDLVKKDSPWTTLGGKEDAAKMLQRALAGDVTGLPGFQLAQRAAMDKAGRSMAAAGQYGGGAYVPGLATAASGNYMNYLNMLGNMAGVTTSPNYNALAAALQGQMTGTSTALKGGLGLLGSLMSLGWD